jgi:VCBS repeat-containing protein
MRRWRRNGTLTTDEDTARPAFAATDVDGDSLTYSIVASSARAPRRSPTRRPARSATAERQPGTDTVTFKATDGIVNSNTATVTITINAVNDAPVATPRLADDAGIRRRAARARGHRSRRRRADLFHRRQRQQRHRDDHQRGDEARSPTPNANANGSADTITFKATDGTLTSNTAAIAITIAPVNDAPVAANGAVTTPEETAISGTLSATDADADTLSFSIVVNGSKGTAIVTNAATGAFTYTPNANATGTDTFTFKASDGSVDSNTATVTITIDSVNDPPVAANDSYATNEDTALNVSAPGVLGNDTDPDSTTLTVALVAGTTHGTLTLNANGSFSYAPAANYHGPDSFTYRANDGSLNSGIATGRSRSPRSTMHRWHRTAR